MNLGTVLIIDDERDLVQLVRYNLEREGFDVIAASDGAAGLEVALRHAPDVVVLDLMMPGTSGLDVCRQLRGDPRTSRMPIIMLTAKAAESDRVLGLELGADDYVTKPFSPRELVARVKAVLRRSRPASTQAEVIRQGRLQIDLARHEVTFDGAPVALTATEFRILQLLAARPGRVFSRDAIIDTALGADAAVMERTVDAHVTAIRRKLGPGGACVETVRGFGYRFQDESSAASKQPC